MEIEEQRKLEAKIENLDKNIGELILTRAKIAAEAEENGCIVKNLVTDVESLDNPLDAVVMDY